MGADLMLRSDASTVSAIRNATGGVGADVIFDMVGADATLALAAKSLRAEGRLVIIGLAMGTLPVNFFALPYGAEVATSYWGTVTELVELVALANAGKLRLDVEVFPLERANEAYERLRRGEIRGRAVIAPTR
jgi:propanol-preferring alcohol dehydrogenase